MKKNTKIAIVICTTIVVILVAVFGGIAIHDKTIVKTAKENLSVNDITLELQKSDVTVTVDDTLNTNGVDCTALFSNNAGSVEINAAEVNEYNEQLTVSLLKPILFNEEIKLDVKISVKDTTPPEFTESVEEIRITEGEEINILESFKAEDLSGDVQISATEIDNTKVGEQTVTVTATDKNNNSATKDVKIIIEAKPEATTVANNSGGNTNTGAKKSNKGSASNNSSSKSSDRSSSVSSSGGSSGGSSGSSNSSSGNSDNQPEVKNVSPKDVQNKVNAYIRSKGITVDSSMTPNNASWSGQISGMQEDLNSGYTLKYCKDGVDCEIKFLGKDTIVSMYCYYSGNDFYILYW